MIELELFVLTTIEEIPGERPGVRSYLFTDKEIAAEAGVKLVSESPSEVAKFDFVVTPLEGAPS